MFCFRIVDPLSLNFALSARTEILWIISENVEIVVHHFTARRSVKWCTGRMAIGLIVKSVGVVVCCPLVVKINIFSI